MLNFVIKKWWFNLDKILFFSTIFFIISGLILIISGSPYIAKRIGLLPYYFFYNQLVHIFPSITLIIFISCLNLKGIKVFTFFIMFMAIIAMIMVLIFFPPIKGSKRWFFIFGFSIQPSEFLKPCFFVFSSLLITKKKYKEVILLYTFIVILLLLQPDFGTAVLLTISFLCQLFVSGISFIICFMVSILGIIFFILAFIFIPHIKIRIDKFILGANTHENFQVMKSMEAFANGGFTGVGPGEGIIKYHLPDAHTDFIFSVAGEEFGILYCLLLLSIFFLFISRVFYHLSNMKDHFTIISLMGLIMQFFLQIVINIGVSLNLFPTKGMTLPFVSYGGSSIIAFGISIGIILAMTKKRSILSK